MWAEHGAAGISPATRVSPLCLRAAASLGGDDPLPRLGRTLAICLSGLGLLEARKEKLFQAFLTFWRPPVWRGWWHIAPAFAPVTTWLLLCRPPLLRTPW